MTNAQQIAMEIRENYRFVLDNGLKNCHAFGLHSLVLEKKTNGDLRRIFIARDWHELWQNEFDRFAKYPKFDLSVAIHPHHCGVELAVVEGSIMNYECVEGKGFELAEFLYSSPITGKAGFFARKRRANLQITKETLVVQGSAISLLPRQLHTVFVEKGATAAWVVNESGEDANYVPRCFSNADLEYFSFEGMYRPMSPKTLDSIIEYLEK